MKLSELIEALKLQADMLDEDPDVFIAYQPGYPKYAGVHAVVSSGDVHDHFERQAEAGEGMDPGWDSVEVTFCDPEGRNLFILANGHDEGYASRMLWRAHEDRPLG